jgi:hypothetical protein
MSSLNCVSVDAGHNLLFDCQSLIGQVLFVYQLTILSVITYFFFSKLEYIPP